MVKRTFTSKENYIGEFMKLDKTLSESIQEACAQEGAPQASPAIIRLVERYISNELPDSERSSALQSIYNLLKE